MLENLGPDIVLLSWAGEVTEGPVSQSLHNQTISCSGFCQTDCTGKLISWLKIEFTCCQILNLTCVYWCPNGQSRGQSRSQKLCSELRSKAGLGIAIWKGLHCGSNHLIQCNHKSLQLGVLGIWLFYAPGQWWPASHDAPTSRGSGCGLGAWERNIGLSFSNHLNGWRLIWMDGDQIKWMKANLNGWREMPIWKDRC